MAQGYLDQYVLLALESQAYQPTIKHLAHICDRMSRMDLALACWKKVIEHEEPQPEYYIKRAHAEYLNNTSQQARETLELAISLFPESITAHTGYAYLYQFFEDLDPSTRQYHSQRARTAACRLALEGRCQTDKEFESGALAIYTHQRSALPQFLTQWIKKHPKSPRYWNTKGIIFQLQGMMKQARECYTKAANLDQTEPHYPENVLQTIVDKKGLLQKRYWTTRFKQALKEQYTLSKLLEKYVV